MGGTEASVVRIADALGAYVMQHNRGRASGRYRPLETIAGVDRVVLVRDSRALPAVRELFPRAQVFLWVHDKMRPRSTRGRWLASTATLMREMSVTVVCVSDSQRGDVTATLEWIGVADEIRTIRLYNPVDDALSPDGSPIDDSKLVFFSSPNKGLDFALDAFRALRRAMPDLRLVIGNPGYKPAAPARIAGVESIGPQPQARIHAEVRSALCTFHPNFRIPETFGLVFAESKAVGTPVLTHDCGAAAEVVGDPEQVLPVTLAHRAYERAARAFPARWRRLPACAAARAGLFDAYIERIRSWRSGSRPRVVPDERFRLTQVAGEWRALLSLPSR